MRYLIGISLLLASSLSAKPIAPPEFDTPQKRFFYFSFSGNIEGIDSALEEGADIDEVTNFKPKSVLDGCLTALQISILQENNAVFDHLLAKGADVNAYAEFYRTTNASPLSFATIYNRRKMVEKLLDAGAEPNKTREEEHIRKYSAVAYAALYGNVDLLKLYASRGADLERPLPWSSGQGGVPTEYPLLSVAAQNGGLEVVRYLVEERGHAVNPSGKPSALPPLSVAVCYGNIEVAKYLITKGADVNAVGYFAAGNTSASLSPLGVAARCGRPGMVKLLFAHGARVRQNADLNEHPMYTADLSGSYRVIEEFERQGHSLDLWSVIEKQFQSGKGRKEKEPLPVSASEFTPTFLKGHRRQWNTADDANLSEPLRLAVIADPKSGEIADLLTVALSEKQHIRLVERDALELVLREQELDRAGLTSGENLSLVAGLLDAQALVIIDTLEVNKKQVFQLRLVNSALGLQFGRSFIEPAPADLNTSIEQYASSVGALTNNFRRDYEKAIPISLVNVRSDLGTIEGLKVENTLKQMLELELLAQPSVILTQRQNLDALIREKDLGGREEEFKASSLFVDVGVELDAGGERPKSYTVSFQPAAGESFKLKMEADADIPLSESASQICRAVMERINANYAESDLIKAGLLSKDAETYFQEAVWNFELGQYDACFENIRTAVSLGYDKRDIFDYYCSANKLLFGDNRGHRGDDENNRIKLDLLRDRLIAIRGILEIYRKDVGPEALIAPKFGNYVRGEIDFGCIIETFNHFRPVAMQRRYAKELKDIERQFLFLINEYVSPCFAEPMPHGKYPFENFPGELFQIVDLMAQFDESEYEKTLDGLMRSCMERAARPDGVRIREWSRHFSQYPYVSSPRWDSMCLKYLGQEGYGPQSTKVLAAHYFQNLLPANYLNEFDSSPWIMPLRHLYVESISERERIAKRLSKTILAMNSEKNRFEPNNFLTNEKFARTFGLSAHVSWNLEEGIIPLSFESVEITSIPYLDYNSEKYEIWMIRKLIYQSDSFYNFPSADPFQHEKSLRFGLDALREATDAEQIEPHVLERIEERIYEYETRLAKLTGEPMPVEKSNLKELPIRLWNPNLNPLSKFSPGSRLLHPPIADEGCWWVLAAVNRGSSPRMENPRYGLFRIDPATLETQVRWLEQPIMKNNFNGPVFARAGRWLAMSVPGETIKMIHLDTLRIKDLPGYIPTISARNVASNGGRFFFFVQPESTGYTEHLGREKSNMQILLRYDPETGKSEVVYNTRRKPAQTMVDGTGRVFHLYRDLEGFLVVYGDEHGRHFQIDCDTLEISVISRKEFSKNEHIRISELRHGSTILSDSLWMTAGYEISKKQIDKLPKESISLALSMYERNGRGSVTNTVIKAVTPKPFEKSPFYAQYEDLVREYKGRYFSHRYGTRSCWFAEDHGYLDLSIQNGDTLWGIFKMSDLAEAIAASPEIE